MVVSLSWLLYSCLDDLSEKRKDEILIHDVDPLALTLLVDFAYTGEIVVTEENVQVITFSVVEKLLYNCTDQHTNKVCVPNNHNGKI